MAAQSPKIATPHDRRAAHLVLRHNLAALRDTPPSVCRDPDDAYLVALTVMTSAEVLVSGDDDLLAVEPERASVEVLTPRQLVERLG